MHSRHPITLSKHSPHRASSNIVPNPTSVKSNNPKGLSESSSEHNCCLFIDIKTYLSLAVSTTVKGVHTAGLLHLYTNYINSHIVTESKKRTTS